MATTKSRQDLRSKFVRNSIPTEQDFKDLIDAQLNQGDDGIFRSPGEPLSIVAGADAQKRCVRLYWDDASGSAPDWLISLNPGQDPNNEETNRHGFGIADGTGVTRLYLDAAGNLGLGTNDPQATLHVAKGDVRIENDLSVGGKVAFAGAMTASGAVTIGAPVTAAGPVTLGKDDGSTDVVIKGAVHAARSDLYFTKTDHRHTGFGNTLGYAAIENAEDYQALMILGRKTAGLRIVQLWDYLEVKGNFKTTGNADIDGSVTIGYTTSPIAPVNTPPGAGAINIGDWSLRANGTTFELVHITRALVPRPPIGVIEKKIEKIVARFDASQTGGNRLTFS